MSVRKSSRVWSGASIVVLCCWGIRLQRAATSALRIRSNEWPQHVSRGVETDRVGANPRVRRSQPRSNAVLHERGLQRDLESGDGAKRMTLECGFEMSEGEFARVLRRDVRRFTQRVKRCPNRALCLVKSLPDAIRRGITQAAVEAAESLKFIAADHCTLQKGPQAIRGQKQASDLVGQPDTEGSSATSRAIPVTAEDAISADRLFALLIFVVTTQDTMPDQTSHTFAMRTSRHLQLGEHVFDFLLGTTNLLTHHSHPSRINDNRRRLYKFMTRPKDHESSRMKLEAG